MDSHDLYASIVGLGTFVLAGLVALGAFHFFLDDSQNSSIEPIILEEVMQPYDDDLYYLSRDSRIKHQIPFEGFSWVGGDSITVIREDSLSQWTDKAVHRWDSALNQIRFTIESGDGCAWKEFRRDTIGICAVEVPYTQETAWDGTTDVASDAQRGIHKARVRLNVWSAVYDGDNKLIQQMVSHELGHAFGLQHRRECTSIMSYCYQVDGPSNQDVQRALNKNREDTT